MKDFFCLDIPLFQVQYKRWKRYGYLNKSEKDNTKEVLTESTGGYCMYCFSRIKVDNKLYGHLEHAIEKNNSDKLIECVPNIGIACPVCNQSFKRMGERKRKLPDTAKKMFEENSRCTVKLRKQCTVACKALRHLQMAYSEIADAEIILQPMGILGKQSGEQLAVQYDVMKMEFQPNTNLHAYSTEEMSFIYKHIQRFRLNDPEYRSRQLADYIKNIIDNEGVIPQYEYNNMVVHLFADRLKGKTPRERVEICSRIYTVIFTKI